MPKITLWGFNNSTYVRTVRMVLAEKGVTDYEQVPLNVLAGEPKSAENLKRHPFGKVPVLDIDGFMLIETPAITRYLDAVLPGRSVVPRNPKNAARMDMVTSIIDSYGYGALLAGVVGYHLFPDFVGGKDETKHHQGLAVGHTTVDTLMKIKGNDPYLAGPDPSIADFYFAPIVAYLTLTPHKDEFLTVPGMKDWWERVSTASSFTSTEP